MNSSDNSTTNNENEQNRPVTREELDDLASSSRLQSLAESNKFGWACSNWFGSLDGDDVERLLSDNVLVVDTSNTTSTQTEEEKSINRFRAFEALKDIISETTTIPITEKELDIKNKKEKFESDPKNFNFISQVKSIFKSVEILGRSVKVRKEYTTGINKTNPVLAEDKAKSDWSRLSFNTQPIQTKEGIQELVNFEKDIAGGLMADHGPNYRLNPKINYGLINPDLLAQ